jgi:ABC-2 type transport system permease protein
VRDLRAAAYAEWTKVWSTPGTAWLPPAAAASYVALDAVVASAGVYSGQIPVIVLAVLLVTAEYDTGLVVATLTAVPRRLVLLAAKALVLVAVLLPAVLVPAALLADRAAGTVLHLVLVALLALGVGAVLRHTAPALTTMLALMYLAPLLARLVPGDVWPQRIERYAPMTAGLTMSWHGFAVLSGYAAVALAGGAVRLSRDLRR